ncbi:MAG: DUF2231 domain-containing protein [Chryseolinea sp.]
MDRILRLTVSLLGGLSLALLTVENAAAAPLQAGDAASDLWLWSFLGRLHPLVIHFPISLIVVALILEILRWRKGNTEYLAAIHVLIITGALSSLFAVVFGLLLPTVKRMAAL